MLTSSTKRIIILVATTFFMETLDGTVIATALPQMAKDFGVSAVDVGIGMSAYLLTLAVLIPISGWMSDRFGARKVFTLAIAIFTLSSLFCGFSQNLTMFTMGRVMQAIGGALMVPVGRIIVLRNTNKENLMTAIGMITWPGLIGPVVGPAIGGFLTTYTSWHWIFFVNLPIGLVGIYLSLKWIKPFIEVQKKPLDVQGFLLCGTSLASLIYAIELTRNLQKNTLWLLIFLVTGIISGALAIAHLRKTQYPMIDLTLMKIPSFEKAFMGGNIFRVTLSSVPFLIPLYLQLGFGMDPLKSGILLLSVFIGNLSMKAITNQILNQFGFKQVMLVNGVVIIATFIVFSLFTKDMAMWLMMFLLFCSGLARSLQLTSMNTLAMADIPKWQISSASSLSSTGLQLSMALGVAVGSLALSIGSLWNQNDPNNPSQADFQVAFWIMALLSFIGIYILNQLPNNAGENIRSTSK